MNAVEYKALQINKIIKESDVFKNYHFLKEKISNKYELQEIEIKELQQELVNLAYTDETDFDKKKEIYITKKKEFDNDPLIKKFAIAYKEVQSMLMDLQDIIESGV